LVLLLKAKVFGSVLKKINVLILFMLVNFGIGKEIVRTEISLPLVVFIEAHEHLLMETGHVDLKKI
jgi:hypothetical protein